MKWFASELHTHTLHSDGNFTVKELCETAKSYGLSCIAMTDHNTMSGLAEVDIDLQEKTVSVIRGIEWTTYYGHMCVLGAEKYVDWRDATPYNIDEKITDIKKYKGVVGVAHPFVIGSPMCTGCHWSFEVHKWENVDYIEIWSEQFPAIRTLNHRSRKMWMNLLDNGYRIAATYGKDWHGKQVENVPSAVTYLGVNDDIITGENALVALREGRTYVTMGPTIDTYIKQSNKVYSIGDQLSNGKSEIIVEVGIDLRKDMWERFNLIPETVSIISNNSKVIDEKEINNINDELVFDVNLSDGWLIVQVNGKAMNKECVLAFTSPFYIA
ncbi:hypothetical protein AN1V17_34050 [Vallitalea sediminicola]